MKRRQFLIMKRVLIVAAFTLLSLVPARAEYERAQVQPSTVNVVNISGQLADKSVRTSKPAILGRPATGAILNIRSSIIWVIMLA